MPNNSCKKAKILRANKKARKGHVVAAERREALERMEVSMRGRGRRRIPIFHAASG